MKALIQPCAQFHIYCKTYTCTNTVKWQIGHPQGPISTMDMYCDECVKSMLANLPDELKPEGPIVFIPEKDAHYEYVKPVKPEELPFADEEEDEEEDEEVNVVVSSANLSESYVADRPEIFICAQCSKTFGSRRALTSHISKAHKE